MTFRTNDDQRNAYAKVVAVDIVEYSTRRTRNQALILDSFTRIVCDTADELGYRRDDQPGGNPAEDGPELRPVRLLPTGDGVLIVIFGHTHRQPLAHLNLADRIIRNVEIHNANDKPTRHEDSARFDVRIGISEGKALKYNDCNGGLNFAGQPLNMAYRVMDTAGKMMIACDEKTYNEISEISADLRILSRFTKREGIEIKHNERVTVYYAKPNIDIHSLPPNARMRLRRRQLARTCAQAVYMLFFLGFIILVILALTYEFPSPDPPPQSPTRHSLPSSIASPNVNFAPESTSRSTPEDIPHAPARAESGPSQ